MAKRTNDRDYLLMGIRIVGDFGATIAVPVVLFSWIGKTLDESWGTRPYLLILGFFLAAILSGVSLTRKAKVYGRRYQELVSSEGPPKATEPSDTPPDVTR